MKPLNQAERKKAFLNFLLIFIITIAIVVTVVFFSMQVPFKQNEQLNEQMAKVQNERIFLSDFKVWMEQTVSLLDSADKVPNPVVVDSKVSSSINAMLAKVNADSVSAKNLFLNVVQNLSDLQSAKQTLRIAASKDEMVKNYKDEADRARQEMLQYKTTYENLVARLATQNSK